MAWAAPKGVCPRCVSAWSVCDRCATSPSARIVGGRRSWWLSRPATMSWAWPGSGGVFCRTVSWDAAQSALCSRASLWCNVARTYQNGCPACRPRAHRPSRSHRRGIWLTTFAAPAGTPVVRSRSACRRRWRMTSASTVWTHGRLAPYCRGREAATPSPSGTVAEMATAHLRVRSAVRATLVAWLQDPPPDASEEVWPQASGIQ